MAWSARFPDPISTPDGRTLRTLQDAGTYITGLPAPTVKSTAWQNAMHVLIEAADHGGPIEFARLGMMRALFPREPVYHSRKKDPVWRNRTKLVRDR